MNCFDTFIYHSLGLSFKDFLLKKYYYFTHTILKINGKRKYIQHKYGICDPSLTD